MCLTCSCYSVAKSCPTLRPHKLQHARLPCPSLSPWVGLTHVHWVSDAIQPLHPVTPFTSCPQSSPASGSFPKSWPLHQVQKYWSFSFSTSPPVNIRGWFPLGLTGLNSLQSKGLSRVFFSTTFGRHQFFYAQPSLCSNSHTDTKLLE